MLSQLATEKDGVSGRSFLMMFGSTMVGACLVIMAALFIIDPYVTGRMTWINHPVSFDTTASKSSVSRIRNPQFNAVVLGNSTLQTLDPDRLNAATGQSFSQITVPGTGPMEQVAMMRYLSRERGSGIKTLILGLDLMWCNPAGMHKTVNPFPFWLYEEHLFAYAKGLFRADNLEALPRRLRVLTGWEKPSRLDGFWNYELHVPQRPYPYDPAKAAAMSQPPHSAAEALRASLAQLPAETKAVLVLTPVYVPPGMTADFAGATGTLKCKEELLAAAKLRPRTAVVDRWWDTPQNRRRELFLDAVHFKKDIAIDVEQGIAQALRDMP
ncbi:MAG: hypothetical protein ACRCWF_03165 [Beijerinckiaceae bacterium]